MAVALRIVCELQKVECVLSDRKIITSVQRKFITNLGETSLSCEIIPQRMQELKVTCSIKERQKLGSSTLPCTHNVGLCLLPKKPVHRVSIKPNTSCSTAYDVLRKHSRCRAYKIQYV